VVNDERRIILPSKIIWDGIIDRFDVFKDNVEVHYGQIGSDYYFSQASRKLI
jgi:hypothetical protein